MSEGSLNPTTEFLLKERHKEIWYRDTQGRRLWYRDTQGMRAEIGFVLPSQGTPEPPEARRRTEGHMIFSNSL